MSADDPKPPESNEEEGNFPPTKWGIVNQSCDVKTSVRMRAQTELYNTYWPPLYAFARMNGKSSDDVEDLLQSFFIRMVKKDGWLEGANQEQGKFRNFLLASFSRFMVDEWRKGQAARRGGGINFISFDKEEAERLFEISDAKSLSPEEAYESNWASTLIENCLVDLKLYYMGKGKLQKFEALSPFLNPDEEEPDYDKASAQLGVSQSAARVQVHRLREKFHDMIRKAIYETVAPGSDVEEEYQNLISALKRVEFIKI